MGPRDKHAMWGSLLLAAGTGIAIEGCANTYMRTGKLFPGPHLYVGKCWEVSSLAKSLTSHTFSLSSLDMQLVSKLLSGEDRWFP